MTTNEDVASSSRMQPDSPETPEACGGVTIRVVLLCLGLALCFGYFIPIIDVKLSNTFLGATHMPVGGIAVLLAIVLLLNPLLRLLGKMSFSRNEMSTVYICCLFSCLIPGHGSENYIIPNLLAPFYYATSENKWLSFLTPYLKPWLTPALNADGSYNKTLVEQWYLGNGGAIPWTNWTLPLIAWGTLILVSYLMLGCLAVILRAQWAQREALRFPLLELPVALTEETPTDGGLRNPLLRKPLLWIGAGISILIGVLNGLNFYYPDVPAVPLSLDTKVFLSEAPWNQIGWTPVQILPIAVGLTYLLTTEVAFSLWFGYWFFKLQYIVAYELGFQPASMSDAIGNTGAAKPFTQYQQIGAFIAFVGLTMWTGREHFGHVAKRAFGLARANKEESEEVMSYPLAFWGFALSFLFLVGWSIAAGISPAVALFLWMTYLVITIGLTRIIAEGGLLFVQPGWTVLGSASQIFNSGPGTWLTPSSIVPSTIIQNSMMVNIRAFLLPSFLQSFKLARENGIRPHPLLALISAVTVIALGMGLYMNIRLGYEHGGLQLFRWFTTVGPLEPAKNSETLLNGTNEANIGYGIWMVIGAAATYLLLLARAYLPWFPFHPIGLLPSMTYPMYVLWFSIFLGWLAKSLIMRFGGHETYRNVMPFFIGLIFGDVINMLLWLVIDGFMGRATHQLLF